MEKKKNAAWVCLLIAGAVELVWGYFMKESHGFTKLMPSLIALVFIIISFLLLERAVRVFGIGMSYAVFTGIGIAGTTLVGILALGEGVSWIKLVSLAALIAGIIGLKLCEDSEEEQEEEEMAE
ncbi:multidrug efflux SMR transporter [Anaerovorax odorimutans]|uniref:Multidrug efflux SMR transporter n=1 Tax=Anaerovorax odorimutans TaxID=109327 RepID=A0ABT1RN18_9FIRM|nr:multidrug efflux SMR transporter [Anaerovorax odorimutans]MCQ4636586.1 multidrug efflux SMR transporter [Anaerovorax odorimutans]